MICNSPSQIYHSALPFSPPSSWLHEYYSAELSQKAKVVKGLQAEWGMSSRTVSFDQIPQVLACQGDTIAVGLRSCDCNIIILDVTTGSQISVLSKHTDWVRALTFSVHGKLLVSGGDDKTINLWDVQTGVVVQTFHGHSLSITSVSISPDCSTVVSGSWDGQIRLWNVVTGECCQITSLHSHKVTAVSFSLVDPQCLVSASEDGIVRHWNVNDHNNAATYVGYHVAFSSDSTKFVSCGKMAITVQGSDSGLITAKLSVPSDDLNSCYFSPDDRFIIGATGSTVYIWDISGSDPHITTTFVGHTSFINSLTFSSTFLISASEDGSIKFWRISMLSTDGVVAKQLSPLLTSASIESVNIQASNGVAFSSDSTGVIKVWDILTGCCMESFKTPAKGRRDVQLIANSLIVVWYGWKIGTPARIHVWDVKKEELLQTIGRCWSRCLDLRISEDGSKVFLLDHQSIQAWSMLTGDVVGVVRIRDQQLENSLIVNGSRVWLSNTSSIGWDFGNPGLSSDMQLNISPNKPRFVFLGQTVQNQIKSSWIEDEATGSQVLCLPERFANVSAGPRWDEQYLVVGYHSGEVLILDFSHICSE